MAKNEGKIFEESIVKSCPDYILVKRLNDNAAGWSGGNNTRFSSNNECDFIMFNDKTDTFYGLEMKSTKEKSLSYWREDFENDKKKQTFMIRKCQILGLQKWSCHKGVFGLIINFRACDNATYFIMIDNFLDYTNALSKKSISIDDVKQMNPIIIDNHVIRTNYKYNMEKFFCETRLN